MPSRSVCIKGDLVFNAHKVLGFNRDRLLKEKGAAKAKIS